MKAVFITGTDTGVGKTVVTGLLARFLLDKGRSVVTQKFVQTGCREYSEDISKHLQIMGLKPASIRPYMKDICPYMFKLAASPHLAARQEGRKISAKKLKTSFLILAKRFDFVIVEGTGGALVPYSHKGLLIDVVAALRIPAIIVAENRLGAINHTLLTIEAVKKRKMRLLGIIFTNSAGTQNNIVLRDNPEIIKRLSGETILGILPRSRNIKLLQRRFGPIGRRMHKLASQLTSVPVNKRINGLM